MMCMALYVYIYRIAGHFCGVLCDKLLNDESPSVVLVGASMQCVQCVDLFSAITLSQQCMCAWTYNAVHNTVHKFLRVNDKVILLLPWPIG